MEITIRDLRYPVLVVAAKQKESWGKYKVVTGPSQYFTFSRLPVRKHYEHGYIFDSAGLIAECRGMSAWPVLDENGWAKAMLENTLVVPILFRAFALFLNIGPGIVESQRVSLDDFKAKILESLRLHSSQKQIDNLSNLFERGHKQLPPADDAKSIVLWVDGWITDRSLKLAHPDDADDDHPAMKV